MKYALKQQEQENKEKQYERKQPSRILASAGLALIVGLSPISSGCASVTGIVDRPDVKMAGYNRNGEFTYNGKPAEIRYKLPWYIDMLPDSFAEWIFTLGTGGAGYAAGSMNKGSDKLETKTEIEPALTPTLTPTPSPKKNSDSKDSDSGDSYVPPPVPQPADTGSSAGDSGDGSGGSTPPASTSGGFIETSG